MTQPVMDNTTNAVWIPTIIAQKSLGRLPSYMNLAKTVSRDFDWTPAQVGATIQVPKRGALVANDKTAGNAYTRQNPTGTNVSVTLNKHKEVTFSIDDVTAVVQQEKTQDGYAEDAAIALAESVETELAKLYASVTKTQALDVSSATTIDNSVLSVRQYFVQQHVPMVEQKYAYVDSTVTNKLLGVDKYTRYDALGNAIALMAQGNNNGSAGTSPIVTGALTRIYGIDFFESQNVQTTGSPAQYQNLCYSKNALMLASRPLMDVPQGMGAVSTVIQDPDIEMGLRSVAHYDGDTGAFVLTLDCLFGVTVVDQRRVAVLTSF